MKRYYIYLLFLFLVFIAIIAIEDSRPKQMDWSETYGLSERKPFGLYVLDQEIGNLMKGNTIQKFEKSFYELDVFNTEEDTVILPRSNFLSISSNFNSDDESINALLGFVSQGNSAFISASFWPNKLLDTFNIKLDYIDIYDYPSTPKFSTNTLNKLLVLDKGAYYQYFKSVTLENTTVLGNVIINKQKYPNFIKLKHGDGWLYLHLEPIAFTNYYLLHDDDHLYAQNLLSHLNEGIVYWSVDGLINAGISQNPLRFIFSQPALNAAWKMILIGLVLFILFNAKRRQRIIPVKEKLNNTTIEFAKTIGNLYYLERDYKDICHKKITYFLEKIRNEYHLDTHELNDSFVNRLHAKTNRDKKDIEKLVRYIVFLENKSILNENELIELNKQIENLNI